MFPPYVLLAIAILSEVVGTLALKASAGFTRVGPSLLVVAGYSVSFYLLSLSLKTLAVGFVYAIWSGLGIVLVGLASIVVFGERIDFAGAVGMALIIAGVLVLNLVSNVAGH